MTEGLSGPSDGGFAFQSGADVTGSRSLDTTFTNGTRRRLVLVSAICSSSVLGRAMIGYTTVLGGTSLSVPRFVGLALGVVFTSRFQVVVPIDPGASYSITSDKTDVATVTLQQWLEVDL